jgi:hypothetical protein
VKISVHQWLKTMGGKQIHPPLFAFFVLFVANGAFWVHPQILRTGQETADGVSDTDRKSLLALRGVDRESEAESVRFHGRKVTRVGLEVKHRLFRVAGRAYNPRRPPASIVSAA